MRILLWATLVVVATAGPISAQAQGIPRQAWDDAKAGVSDIVRIWTAPLHTDADDLPAIGAALGGTAVVWANDRRLADWVRDHQGTAALQAFKPFREGHPLLDAGGGRELMIASAALYVPGLVLGQDGLRQAGLGCAAAVEAGSLFRHVIYGNVSRARPSVSDDPNRWALKHGDWDHHSFYGGHAANAMTCATYWATRFDLGPAEPLLYAVGLGVSLGRTADLRHWPSDTFIGALYGFAVGRLEAKRMARRAERRDTSEVGVQAGPPAVETRFLVAPGGRGSLLVGAGARF